MQRRAASFLHGTVENGLEDDKKRQEDSLGVSRRVRLRKSKNSGAAAEVEGRELIRDIRSQAGHGGTCLES